jgi:ectoine hydroxylase-related dioxygenase (phytanoyl-CoA dioxygenase family)
MSFALTRDECLKFYRDGYLGPLTLVSPEEMAEMRAQSELEILNTPGPFPKNPEQMRHLDHPVVASIVSHPALVQRVASLLGPDLVVWRSNFFNKAPGGKEVPWHQDINYWQIDPPLNITAWIALDDVTTENSCVRVIPGSHKKVIPHVPSVGEMQFQEMADPRHVQAEKAVDMVLKAGQFFIFSERILHQSNPNHSSKRRMCMVVRMTTPFVVVPPLYDGYKPSLVSGSDRFGFNEYAPLAREAAAV